LQPQIQYSRCGEKSTQKLIKFTISIFHHGNREINYSRDKNWASLNCFNNHMHQECTENLGMRWGCGSTNNNLEIGFTISQEIKREGSKTS